MAGGVELARAARGAQGRCGRRAPEPASSACGGRTSGAGRGAPGACVVGARGRAPGGQVRDAERRGLVWAGAGVGPAADTLGARGSLTASEEEDSAQTS